MKIECNNMNVIVLSQNLRLDSLIKFRTIFNQGNPVLIVSTQLLFDFEKRIIEDLLLCSCSYVTFSDLLTDEEAGSCDEEAFEWSVNSGDKDVFAFYDKIKVLKNKKILFEIGKRWHLSDKYIVCDDLGIDIETWISGGYKFVECSYYSPIGYPIVREERQIIRRRRSFFYRYVSIMLSLSKKKLYVARQDGRKYLFFGSLNRISYRLNLDFKVAGWIERIRYLFDIKFFNSQPYTIRLSTLHEGYHALPDRQDLNYKILQDGYLPTNYTSNYFFFFGKNVEFYTWDRLGLKTFDFFSMPAKIIPFRKKILLPYPSFPPKIRKVLCVASGAGDWTAIKNRSDEDRMLYVIGCVAQKCPDIEFIYRCHPVWVHPQHQGVNSINRAAAYIESLNLKNFSVSSNIPNATADGAFCVSYKRSSLDEDLKDADLVLGEHSISMIDAAIKGILFSSINVTGRRNLFAGITAMGFPHCCSVEDVISLFVRATTTDFCMRYNAAIDRYNSMTNED